MFTARKRRSHLLLVAALLAAVAGSGATGAGAAEPGPPGGAPVAAPVPGPSTAMGAHYDADRSHITFRVYSARATRIAVYLYDSPSGSDERVSRELSRDAATGVWSTTVPVAALRNDHGISDPVWYGYRAWGPNWPWREGWTKGSPTGFVADVDAEGNRFNPNKLLIDPYARELSHDPRTPAHSDETVYATGPRHRTKDSGRYAPKGLVLPGDGTGTGRKPARALRDDIVYEVHVRGLTRNDPSVPAELRGTYAGAARKAEELAALGVTAVEFLPLQETQNDANDADPDSATGDNYWGYSTLDWFAPDRRYAADRTPGGPTREFKAMVRAFHDAGIKVLADVVYNHTAEGGPWQRDDKNTYSLLSLRGLDNPAYYSLTADRQWSWDNTGVGGNVNTYHPAAQRLIIDSLRYWSDELGVDGFRFDLASVLGNTCEHACFRYGRDDPATALNRIGEALPARPAGGGAGTDLIAEPWALGEGTYQVGNFPAGWAEWNDSFRDTLRRDQNKLGHENVTPGQLATRFAGSSDLYGDDGRRPYHSVNFMTVHDGLTLADLYGCNGKYNDQAWPYGPSDGGSENNLSWDQGGDRKAQRQAARNGFAFLALSAGTPTINGGDETLRSLKCNNNPYNLDSPANWLDHAPGAEQSTFRTFAQRMLAFREAHPALRPAGFYSGSDGDGDGMPQLSWFTPAGSAPDAAYWDDPGMHGLAWRIDGSELGDTSGALYVAYNGWHRDVDFTLPPAGAGKRWYRVTDTAAWAEGADQVARPGSEPLAGSAGGSYRLHGRSVLVLLAR